MNYESNKIEESEIFGNNKNTYKKYIRNKKPELHPYFNNKKYGKLKSYLKPKLSINYGISKKQLH